MIARFRPAFVTVLPERLEPGVLYVSMEYATVSHLCACGCGNEAVTDLSPAGWDLRYDGVDVTLRPSIGNWSFPCRSHYLIRSGRVVPAKAWDNEQVAAGRARDAARTGRYYTDSSGAAVDGSVAVESVPSPSSRRWWFRLRRR